MVATGKADIDCANTTATQSRMGSVDFSNLIFVETGGFLALGGGPVQKLADLSGKRVGVIGGTTTEARLEQALKQRLINANVVKLKDGNEGVAMLESGLLDAFASDKIKLIGLATPGEGPVEARAAGRGPVLRAARVRPPARRFVVPAGGEQGADADLRRRRPRPDLRALVRHARQAGAADHAMYLLNSVPE